MIDLYTVNFIFILTNTLLSLLSYIIEIKVSALIALTWPSITTSDPIYAWPLNNKHSTQSTHGSLFDDVGVDRAITQHVLSYKSKDDSGQCEPKYLFTWATADGVESILVHFEVIEAIEIFSVLWDEFFFGLLLVSHYNIINSDYKQSWFLL